MTDRIYVIAQAPLNQDGSPNEDKIKVRSHGYPTKEDGIMGLCAILDIARSALLEDEDGAVIQVDGFQYMLFPNQADPIKTH